jgi:alpha-galactosidase
MRRSVVTATLGAVVLAAVACSGDGGSAADLAGSGGAPIDDAAASAQAGGAAGAINAAGVDVARPPSVLAATPPMGWNSWNRFGCDVSEDLIKGIADAMVSSGMKAAGYEYVNIDDCWQVGRADDGTIIADPARFPSGMTALADYVHGKGLKLGVYSDRGTATCAGRPGSQGYETKDAETYARWGVDYLKYDNCTAALDQKTQYETMRDALRASGRGIVFSICAWQFASWMPETGQLWRTTGDIRDNWESVCSILDVNANLAAFAEPGRYNDPDMLEVGNGNQTSTEYRAHFGLWAIMAAPLIAGNDVRSMSSETRDILTAPEIIAVDQDPAGNQGIRVRDDGDLEVWAKTQAAAGVRAVALFNRGASSADITVSWQEIRLNAGPATVRDLWARKDLGAFTDRFTATVSSHAAVMLTVAGSEPPPPSGTVHLSDVEWLSATSGWGPVERDMSNGDQASGDGRSISIAGQTYAKGIGVHAAARVAFALGGACTRLSAEVGVDDEVADRGSVVFQVWGDGTKLYDSGMVTGSMAATVVDIDVTGTNRLTLVVTDGGDGTEYDHADWADAKIACR